MHLDAGTLQGVHHTRKKLDLSEEGEHRRMLTEIVVKVSDEVVVGCELADTQVSGQKSFGMPLLTGASVWYSQVAYRTSWNGTRSARGPAQKLPRWSGVVDPGLVWLAWPKTKFKILGPARALEWAG